MNYELKMVGESPVTSDRVYMTKGIVLRCFNLEAIWPNIESNKLDIKK